MFWFTVQNKNHITHYICISWGLAGVRFCAANHLQSPDEFLNPSHTGTNTWDNSESQPPGAASVGLDCQSLPRDSTLCGYLTKQVLHCSHFLLFSFLSCFSRRLNAPWRVSLLSCNMVTVPLLLLSAWLVLKYYYHFLAYSDSFLIFKLNEMAAHGTIPFVSLKKNLTPSSLIPCNNIVVRMEVRKLR